MVLQAQFGEWPTNRLRFVMEGSFVDALAGGPQLVLLLNVPESYIRQRGPAGREEVLRELFREFAGRDSVTWFSGGQWANAGAEIQSRVFPDLPENDPTIQLGDRIEKAKARNQKGDFDFEPLRVVSRTVVPQDLVIRSTGLRSQGAASRVRCGADVSQLPVPPPVTLESYDPHGLVVAGLGVRGHTDDLSISVGFDAFCPSSST
jgi:hypothetical protein